MTGEEAQKIIDTTLKYVFYKNLMESKGFKFMNHQRPFDIWFDGKDYVGICQPCRKLMVNGRSLTISINLGIDRALINYLFNNKIEA